MSLPDAARAAFDAGLIGDFRASDGWLRSASGARSLIRIVLEAQRFYAEPGQGRIASPEELRAYAESEPGYDLAVEECGRSAVLAADLPRLEAYASLSPRPTLLHAWLALGQGRAGEAVAAADAFQRDPSPARRIEAACIRALGRLEGGALEEARALARSASRMARTEDFPQSQYLSNLVLSRIRRFEGAPHLALRITDALAAVVSSPWGSWVAWEQALSGRIPTVAAPESEGFRELLASAQAGDLAGFDRAGESLLRGARWPGRRHALKANLAVLDPRVSAAAMPEEVRAFCDARGDAPGIVCGICTAGDFAAAGVLLLLLPDGRFRRIAGLGERLARTLLGIDHEPLSSSRTQLAIGALATNDSVSRDALFRKIYGFAFDVDLHDGLFRTLRYRVRKWLGDRGEMRLEGDDFRLELREPLLIPDPRCEESLEDRMLRYLARTEHQSAQEASRELGVPLRTAQGALQALIASGSVEGRRKGRRIEYRVEDTTFSEPTRWR
ncbi:MAG: hypothetical protein AAGF12_17405 [Myxococcota bacterium]